MTYQYILKGLCNMPSQNNKAASFICIVLSLLLFLIITSCKSNEMVSHSSLHEEIVSAYPIKNGETQASFVLANKHESHYYTSDIPYLISYPLKWRFVFVKYVIKEDLYGKLESNKTILVPIGVSLSKTSGGARPKCLFADGENLTPNPSNPYESENQEDPSAEIFRTIGEQYATYYFNLYSHFLIYIKNYQPVESETILSDLDLHYGDTSVVDLDALKESVDYIAYPTYLDRELNMLPFNYSNNEQIDIERFYYSLFGRNLDECPIFYQEFLKIQKCFLDKIDTFETIKSRINI